MMICGMCLNEVSKFQTGSHIVPRWVMRAVKDGEPMDLIDGDVVRKSQEDIKGDFICETCERLTGKDDKFAERFLRYGRGEIIQSGKDHSGFGCSVERFSYNQHEPFVRFIASVFLRFEIYSKVNGAESILGSRFEEMRSRYINADNIHTSFPVIFERYTAVKKFIREPHSYRYNGVLLSELVILGWRCIMRVDSAPSPLHDKVAWQPEFNVLLYQGNGPLLELMKSGFENGTRK